MFPISCPVGGADLELNQSTDSGTVRRGGSTISTISMWRIICLARPVLFHCYFSAAVSHTPLGGTLLFTVVGTVLTNVSPLDVGPRYNRLLRAQREQPIIINIDKKFHNAWPCTFQLEMRTCTRAYSRIIGILRFYLNSETRVLMYVIQLSRVV